MNLKIKFSSDIKISLIYVILGSLWIQFSDKVMRFYTSDESQLKQIEIIKGWFYVAITGILLYYLIHYDLKQKNKILHELEISKKKAEESDRLKSAFLANLSHYLRTPMNSILGFVDLLKNRNLDKEKRDKFLSVINEQSNHLLQFINSIIEIAKLQDGQTIVNVKEFSLNTLLEKLHYRYQTELEIAKKSGRIQLKRILNTHDTMLKSDPDKIEYILTNLLSNSLKFTRKGEIRFGYQLKTDTVEFFVLDTGDGIPEEKKTLITKTFMLSDPDVGHENIGIGLGLAITNGLVKLLNGHLWLEKSNDKETEFKFIIPLNPNSTNT